MSNYNKKTDDEIRAEFEKSCAILTKGSTNPFARAKKDRDYLKEGDYILSDMRVAWQVAEPLLNIIAAKDAEIARLIKELKNKEEVILIYQKNYISF